VPTVTGRRRLALPEAQTIAALLGEVMGDLGRPATPTEAAALAPVPADPPVRTADLPTRRFLGAVNWRNDPTFVGPAGSRAGAGRRRPADVPAGRFLAAVNWTNHPAGADAADALLNPDAGPDRAGEPWETGGYLSQFAWD
jgi:hypothetical protein